MFEGKVAVVTGGASGIGYAMAAAFGRRGATVMLGDLDEPALEEAVIRLRGEGVEADGLATDVTNAGSVEALAEATQQRFGTADIVCNNAGVALYGSVLSATERDWEFAMGVNLYGVIHGIRAFVPRLLERGEGGHIVNTASMSGLVGMEQLGVYCASKFAVVGLSESLAREMKPHGIGVSVLCPMIVDTPITENSVRMRPERLRTAQPEPEVGPLVGGVIQPAAVAERVVNAVEQRQLYILTHPEQRSILARRAERLDAAAASLGP